MGRSIRLMFMDHLQLLPLAILDGHLIGIYHLVIYLSIIMVL